LHLPVHPPQARPAPAAPTPAPAPSVDDATFLVLREGVAATDYATRLTATEALGCVPGPDATALLADQLGDPEPDVRAAALLALDRRGSDARALGLLSSVRDDRTEDLDLRVLAAAALATPNHDCK
jgi:HEAT repeat protein